MAGFLELRPSEVPPQWRVLSVHDEHAGWAHGSTERWRSTRPRADAK
jgi:hypothetical protein